MGFRWNRSGQAAMHNQTLEWTRPAERSPKFDPMSHGLTTGIDVANSLRQIWMSVSWLGTSLAPDMVSSHGREARCDLGRRNQQRMM